MQPMWGPPQAGGWGPPVNSPIQNDRDPPRQNPPRQNPPRQNPPKEQPWPRPGNPSPPIPWPVEPPRPIEPPRQVDDAFWNLIPPFCENPNIPRDPRDPPRQQDVCELPRQRDPPRQREPPIQRDPPSQRNPPGQVRPWSAASEWIMMPDTSSPPSSMDVFGRRFRVIGIDLPNIDISCGMKVSINCITYESLC